MELNGARSNPPVQVELARLADLHGDLLRTAATHPRLPRAALPARVSLVLDTITLVLERAERPMRACEIHAAAEELAGQPLLWTSVKGTLAAYACGADARFRRIRRGVYELAR